MKFWSFRVQQGEDFAYSEYNRVNIVAIQSTIGSEYKRLKILVIQSTIG